MSPRRFTAASPKHRTSSRRSSRSRWYSSSLWTWPAIRTVVFLLVAATALVAFALDEHYTFTFQSPVRMGFQWPLVITANTDREDAAAAQADQSGHRLTAYQQYACNKFGTACRVALAIQRAENPRGECEVYHYNTNGTLDWGYFQINTVHLKRPGLNLRDLLDCRANIDFAYQLYTERGFEPWSTYNSGAYQKFLKVR